MRTGDGREVGARAGDGVAGEELVHVRVVEQEGRAAMGVAVRWWIEVCVELVLGWA